jgi:hypothetical protein
MIFGDEPNGSAVMVCLMSVKRQTIKAMRVGAFMN